MEFINLTPFAAAAFRQLDRDGFLDGYIAARACFVVRPDEPMRERSDQPDFRWEDVYEGDPHSSCLVGPADLVPAKPGADVTFLGDSYAPDGSPAARWTASIHIQNRLERRLNVTGPRQWRARTRRIGKGLFKRKSIIALDAWEITEPLPARSVPMCWTLAPGGRTLGLDEAEPNEPHPENPLGIGVLDERRSDFAQTYPAPQITNAEEALEQVRGRASPAGFGPISPWWRQRLRYAGTYDDKWLAERHPLLPLDFDHRFWQCAPPPMIVSPWLQGNECFQLENLHPECGRLRGRLPGLKLTVNISVPNAPREERELALDGVHFDFRDGAQDCHLTFRARFPLDKTDGVRLVLRAFDFDYRRWRPKPNPLRRSGRIS